MCYLVKRKEISGRYTLEIHINMGCQGSSFYLNVIFCNIGSDGISGMIVYPEEIIF